MFCLHCYNDSLALRRSIAIPISNLTAAVAACRRMVALSDVAVLRGKEVLLLFGRGGGDMFFFPAWAGGAWLFGKGLRECFVGCAGSGSIAVGARAF